MQIDNIDTDAYAYPLFRNVHLSIPLPSGSGSNGKTYLTRGNFLYFHYGCDHFNDVGWGCAYRTLQSVCSWIINTKPDGGRDKFIPSVRDIQSTLVSIQDKPESFIGSKEWIGALEVFYVIDTLYDTPCRIEHIPKSNQIKRYAGILKNYFEQFGGLIMMGGDVDSASKAIAGIHIANNEAYLLIIDPHFIGQPKSIDELIEKNFIRWQHTSDFENSSFYNLCLPQIKFTG